MSTIRLGRIKEVYYPFNDKKKKEDLNERLDYGLLTGDEEPFKFKLNFQSNIHGDGFASLLDQLKEIEES